MKEGLIVIDDPLYPPMTYDNLNNFQKYCDNQMNLNSFVKALESKYQDKDYIKTIFSDFQTNPIQFITSRKEKVLFNYIQHRIISTNYKG